MLTPPWQRPSRSAASPVPVNVARLSDDTLPTVDLNRPPFSGRRIVAGGAQLFIRPTPATGPDPEPALYVHGLAGSSLNWTDLAATLAPWLEAEAIDLPGFGLSGPAPGFDYSIGALARVVIAYLEQRGQLPVHLFGNSLGGAVSLWVAAERPDLIRTLTLVSPAVPDLRLRRKGSDAGLAPLLFVPGIEAAMTKHMSTVSAESRVRQMIDVCFADPDSVPPARLAEAAADITARRHLAWDAPAFAEATRGLVRSYLSVGRRSPWRQMTRITAPTLVVWGAHDKLVDVSLAPRVARTVPGARLLVLPDAGHVAQIEDPLIVARAFLALKHDAASRPDADGVKV